MDGPTQVFSGALGFELENPSASILQQNKPEDGKRVPGLSYGDKSIMKDSSIVVSSAPFVALPDMSLMDGPIGPDQETTWFYPQPLFGAISSSTIAAAGSPKLVSQIPNTQSSTSSRRSSTSLRESKSWSATSYPPSEAEPPKKRRGRKSKIKRDTVVEEENRSKNLEKNRVAASKSRLKKKEYVADLEKTKIGLEQRNANLHLEYNGLFGELISTKNRLMTHASCNDQNIDQWLENEARKFVQNTKERSIHSYSSSGRLHSHLRYFSVTSTGLSSTDVTAASSHCNSVADRQIECDSTIVQQTNSNNASRVKVPSEQKSSTGLPFDKMRGPIEDEEDDNEINYDHMPDGLFYGDRCFGWFGVSKTNEIRQPDVPTKSVKETDLLEPPQVEEVEVQNEDEARLVRKTIQHDLGGKRPG